MTSTLRRPASGLAFALALVVALPVGLAIVGGSAWLLPAHTSTAIPSTVYRPLPFTATAQDAPPGPATLLISGEGALRGS